MKNRIAMLLCILLLTACSKSDKIKAIMELELQDSGDHVAEMNELRDAGLYCKLIEVKTVKGKTIYTLFRLKNGSLDEHFHPNYTFLSSPSDFLPARDSAMCN